VTAIPPVNSNRDGLFVNVYPNPGEQNITIDLNLPESGNAQIDLLSINGQKMKTVHSGFLTKGFHTINFKTGLKLQGGIYLLRMNTKTLSGSVRLVLK
jgi:hypothetical protein